MYIYHALISVLSTHMIHINLNTIFYTHLAQSHQNNLHKVLYENARTHTFCLKDHDWISSATTRFERFPLKPKSLSLCRCTLACRQPHGGHFEAFYARYCDSLIS